MQIGYGVPGMADRSGEQKTHDLGCPFTRSLVDQLIIPVVSLG